jgi:hypothetical protein
MVFTGKKSSDYKDPCNWIAKTGKIKDVLPNMPLFSDSMLKEEDRLLLQQLRLAALGKIADRFNTIVDQMAKVKTKRGMITKLEDLRLLAIEKLFELDPKRLQGGKGGDV